MFIDWQTQTYEDVNYAFADKDFLKEGGHAGFQIAAQNWSPIVLAQQVSLRFSIIAKMIQTTLAKTQTQPSKDFQIFSNVNLDQKEKPILISVKNGEPNGHIQIAKLIQTIENEFKSMNFHWRLWSFEFYASFSLWHSTGPSIQTSGPQEIQKFFIWIGISQLRDQEKSPAGDRASRKQWPREYLSLLKAFGNSQSNDEFLDIVFQAKRNLLRDFPKDYDEAQFQALTEFSEEMTPMQQFFQLCKIQYFRSPDFVMPSSSWLYSKEKDLAAISNLDVDPLLIVALSCEIYGRLIGSDIIAEKSQWAFLWSIAIRKVLDNTSQRDNPQVNRYLISYKNNAQDLAYRTPDLQVQRYGPLDSVLLLEEGPIEILKLIQ